jgi:hypothetical protein
MTGVGGDAAGGGPARRSICIVDHHWEETNDMDIRYELTPEQASRLAATAVTADLEHWARSASVDGRVGLNDLVRVLDVIRMAGTLGVTG